MAPLCGVVFIPVESCDLTVEVVVDLLVFDRGIVVWFERLGEDVVVVRRTIVVEGAMA
jgi:hypothetical protein